MGFMSGFHGGLVVNPADQHVGRSRAPLSGALRGLRLVEVRPCASRPRRPPTAIFNGLPHTGATSWSCASSSPRVADVRISSNAAGPRRHLRAGATRSSISAIAEARKPSSS